MIGMFLFLSSSLTSIETNIFPFIFDNKFLIFFSTFSRQSVLNVSAGKADILVTENNERKMQ